MIIVNNLCDIYSLDTLINRTIWIISSYNDYGYRLIVAGVASHQTFLDILVGSDFKGNNYVYN